MAARRLVTIVGATGAQGGSVVRALIDHDQYKIRGLTRDANSSKAKAIGGLSDQIEMVNCDINKDDDVRRAFEGSWAIYAVTDFWAQPDRPEVEMEQGRRMADIAAELKSNPYFIFSTLEDVDRLSGGKYHVPHFSQKSRLRDYIKEKHPQLKSIFVEPGFYMQNWNTFFKPTSSPDGTLVFSAPVPLETKLHLVDIEDTGPAVREILNQPEKFVGKDICICGDLISFGDLSKVFSKVTGKTAISRSVSDEEFRQMLGFLPKMAQDDLLESYKWFEEYGYYGREKDWTTGKQLAPVKTFEEWLKTSGWSG